jgi:hypothetical protein
LDGIITEDIQSNLNSWWQFGEHSSTISQLSQHPLFGESSMTERDRSSNEPPDDTQLMRAVERSFAFWAMGIELMRATVDDWAQRRQEHLHQAMKALSAVGQIPSEKDRVDAVSNVMFEQMENIVKDLTAASLRAMTYQGALAQKFGEEIRDNVASMAAQGSGPFPSSSPEPTGQDKQ